MSSHYHYYISRNYLIIALKPLEHEDLNFFKLIMSNKKGKFNKVILELNSYEIIDNASIEFINKIIYFFRMYGLETYASGILPETAYFLSNLNVNINAKTYLNLDRVIKDDK